MANIQTEWTYPLLKTTQDKAAARVAVQQPNSYQLRGVDGQLNDGQRVAPGFQVIHELMSATNTGREVEDVFSFKMLVGTGTYAYGFVYRLNVTTTSSTVYIDYYVLAEREWFTQQLVGGTKPSKQFGATASGRDMSIAVQGRLLYVFVEGENPVLFYLDPTTPFAANVNTNPGPGLKPEYIKNADGDIAIGGLTTIPDADRPCRAALHLIQQAPSVLSGGAVVLNQTDDDVKTLLPGDYAFGYMLHDSQTGRWSAFSEIAEVRTDDFSPIADLSSTSVDESIPFNLYAALELVYDPALFNQAYVYRSVRVQGAGSTFTASILHLDGVIDLEDYDSGVTASGTLDHSFYYYELEDKELVSQDIYLDDVLHDERMPKGGSSYFYENTMLVSQVRGSTPSSTEEDRKGDDESGVGETRWSSLSFASAELFPPSNRYVPETPGNPILKFCRAGPNMVGFAVDRQYLVRKEYNTLRFYPVHEGYGILGNKGADSVGSMVYFVTPKGLKSVDSNAEINNVQYADEVIIDRWPRSSLKYVSVAYDPTLSCLFVHNNVEMETLCFWFNTYKHTELADVNFHQVFRGYWPDSPLFSRTSVEYSGSGLEANSSYDNPLVERAMFVKQISGVYGSANPQNAANFRVQVCVYDDRRVTTQKTGTASGERRVTAMPYEGDSVFEVTAYSSGVGAMSLDLSTKTLGDDVWGTWLYVVKSNTVPVGTRGFINDHMPLSGSDPVGVDIRNEDLSLFTNLAVGDLVAISPQPFEWIGAPIGPVAPDGSQFKQAQDFFIAKKATSLRAYFSDVDGTYDDDVDLCRYEARMYKGAQDGVVVSEFPTSDAGDNVVSVVDGASKRAAGWASDAVQSNVVCPAVRVLCPDLDFRLLGVKVGGTITSASTVKGE